MSGLSDQDREANFERLAAAIDDAGPDAQVFLAKLALTLAETSGGADAFARAVEIALQDLPSALDDDGRDSV